MRIINRRAPYDYTVLENVEAGVRLSGPEVKSLRAGQASLEGSHVRIIGSEAYLVNARISPYAFARLEGYDPKRTRKLLMHKREILRLKSRMDSAQLTLIPLSWYNNGPHIKLEVALARGKKTYEKREKKKQEDIEREVEREYKKRLR